MRFYGREDELHLMEQLYQKTPSFLVITGRRRIGKTTLVREFIRSRPSLYFFVDNHKKIDHLMEEYSQILSHHFNLPSFFSVKKPSDLFDFLIQIKEPVVVVFDEFQRFSQIYPPFYSELQNAWDQRPNDSGVFLIVTGSSIGMMNRIFQDGGAPLFKRANTRMTLRPFGVTEIFPVLDDLTSLPLDEKLKIYYLFGGIIHYYYLFEKFSCHNFSDILEKMICNEFGPLRREISDILVEEFGSEHASYHAIIAALAGGKTSMKEIGDRAGISVTSLHPYLDNLINLLGIVTYQVPIGDLKGRSRLGRYFLTDPFFRFYARFVYPNMSTFEAGNYSSLIKTIHSGWNSYAGKCFEELVKEVIISGNSSPFELAGPWWNRKGDEIDLVAINREGTLVVECKNHDLPEDQARDIIRIVIKKTDFIPCITHPATYGVAARRVIGKEKLKKDGYFVWDLQDFSIFLNQSSEREQNEVFRR